MLTPSGSLQRPPPMVWKRVRARGARKLKNEKVVFSEFSTSALWYVNSLPRFPPSVFSVSRSRILSSLSSVSSRCISATVRLFASFIPSLYPRINNRTFSVISLTVNSKCKFSTRQRGVVRSVCRFHPFLNYFLHQGLHLLWCLAFTRKQQIISLC